MLYLKRKKLQKTFPWLNNNKSFPEDLSFGQRPQTTAGAADFNSSGSSNTTNTRTNHSSDMKRSAVKELIERYFYQLQRGCGNPKCTNVNCASSGKVAAMTPNEIAAKAIQLFSQDAKLCECYTQPPKVPRTGPQHESPTSSTSRSASNATPLSLNEAMDSYVGAQEQNSGGSSTSNSTITSGSSTSSSSTGSSNTNISSCATEEMPLLVALGESNTTTSGGTTALQTNDTNNIADVAGEASTSSSKSKTSDPPTPTFEPVEYLNEQILDELIEECKKYKRYDRLIHAINQVYCSVKKLSKSFRRPPLNSKLTSTATASKLQEILGKSPQELKKEDLRTLEGEHDKDEDSTLLERDNDVSATPAASTQRNDPRYRSTQQSEQQQRDDLIRMMEDESDIDDFLYHEQETTNESRVESQENATNNQQSSSTADIATSSSAAQVAQQEESVEPMDEDRHSDDLDDICEWSHSCDTQVDFESLRRVKKKLYSLKKKAVREALNENIIFLAESIKYGRFYDWEKVLHCFVICFDMSMTCEYGSFI